MDPDEYVQEWEAGWRIDCDRPLAPLPTPLPEIPASRS